MFIFQLQVTTPDQPFTVSNPFAPALLSGLNQALFFIILDILILVGLVFLLGFLIRLLFRRKTLLPFAFQKVILLITVPKEASEFQNREENVDTVRGQIGLAESLFSTLGGIKAQRGIKSWLFGRNDHFSLEIVADQGLISFYVGVPVYMRDYLEQQLLAQYPEANITQVRDYNIFSPQGTVLSAYLRLTREYIFPINTYQRLSSDSLNSITNSLSRVQKGDGAAIQIIARSAKKKWHYKGSKIAQLMQEGKTLSEALAETGTFNLAKLGIWFSPKKSVADESKRLNTPSPMQQEVINGIEQKTSKAGLDCNIRVVVSGSTEVTAQNYMKNVLDSFSQFNFYQYGNSFKSIKEKPERLANDFIYRSYRNDQRVLLNTEELATIFHLPTPFLETPNIRWLLARRLAPPTDLPQAGLYLGESIYRGQKTDIYLPEKDRSRHLYLVGMTGTGKSVLLANLALQDIKKGHGVCVIDPHGSLVESVLEGIPKERAQDVIYFNPSDVDRPIGLNMLEAKTPEQQDFATQEMISIFYKLVTDPSMIGPVFEHNMRNAMLTLMADKENPGTIVEIPRIFTDREFQRYKLTKVTDPMVRAFWEQEMAKTSDFHKSETLGYLISKVGRFVENAMVRNIIGQTHSGFDFRQVMDDQKILLVNLAKGTTGEVNSNLLGLILVAKLQMAALSRTNIAEEERKDFYLYIDEFQNFITDSVSTILAEARKYKLNLILAHQYLGQLTEGAGVEGKSYGDKIKDSIFGNVGTLVSFRLGVEDAEFIAKQFAPNVNEYDLMNIERFNAYARLLVDNQPTKPFNLKTAPPHDGNKKIVHDIKEFSRRRYGAQRSQVEADIIKRSQLGINLAKEVVLPTPRSL